MDIIVSIFAVLVSFGYLTELLMGGVKERRKKQATSQVAATELASEKRG